jgi:geranylgeranyl diphosphate synthase type II
MSSSFAEFLEARRAVIDARLEGSLLPSPDIPPTLLAAMRHGLLAPGKRLRPLLVLLASEACGCQDEAPWPAAIAAEMTHAYSLIHDDLPAMDDDDLRRGLPTCHVQFGEATAILAGDGLLTLAFEVLATGYPGRCAAAMCADLARAAGPAGMVGGQADDLALERGQASTRTLEALEHVHTRKTGALISACLRLGVRAAHADSPDGPPDGLLDRFSRFGRCVGLAFQITDDLLDASGDAQRMGKKAGKDASRNKLTYPGLLGVEESRRRAEALGREAVSLLRPLGPAASRLEELVTFVLDRDR